MDERPADVFGQDPVETDNGVRIIDGEQSVTQDAADDYTQGGED